MVVADLVASVLIGLGALRGLAIGLVREVFSVAALGGAVVVVALFAGPAAEWLEPHSGLTGTTGRVAAGLALVAVTVTLVALSGRMVRRGLRAAGLGMFDRLAGGLLGAAEGALAAAVLIFLAVGVAGREHPVVADSRSLAAFELLEDAVREGVSARAGRDETPPVGTGP